MPVITLQEFSNHCQNGLDIAFQARKFSNVSQAGRLQTFEKILKIPLVNKPMGRGKGPILKVPGIINPKSYLKKKREEAYIHLSKKSAEEAYGPVSNPDSNDGKCALWIEPYRNMIFQWAVEKWAQNKDGKLEFQDSDENDSILDRPEELTVRMINATKRPKSVRNAASRFWHEIMHGKSYLAMHWRYDPTDFGRHCSGRVDGLCGVIFRNKEAGHQAYVDIGFKMAEYINKTVNRHLEEIKEHHHENHHLAHQGLPFHNSTYKHPPLKHRFVYIAAPPSESKVINSMKEALMEQGIHVYFGEDLEKWFEKNYKKNCDSGVLSDQKHDFISLVEMQICYSSDLFIYSGGSSWSRNIVMERQAERRGGFDTGNGMFLDWTNAVQKG